VSASYLTAVGTRRIRLGCPKIDANFEPWPVLGHLATETGWGGSDLGLGYPMQAAAIRPLPPKRPPRCSCSPGDEPSSVSNGRRRKEQTLRRGLVKSGGTFRRSHSQHSRTVEFRRRTRHLRFALLAGAQRSVRCPLARQVARDLDCLPRAAHAAGHRPLLGWVVSRRHDIQAQGLRRRPGKVLAAASDAGRDPVSITAVACFSS
jgi:hypothetical protein